MNLYYNLTPKQARHAASLKSGDEIVFVVPTEQLSENLINCLKSIWVGDEYVHFADDMGYSDVHLKKIKLPYPIGSRVGLRETWLKTHNGKYFYKADLSTSIFLESNTDLSESDISNYHAVNWLSSQCQPIESIRHWGMVIDSRVCHVQDVTFNEWEIAGFVYTCEWYINGIPCHTMANWFNCRYKKFTWAQNPFVQVCTWRKD